MEKKKLLLVTISVGIFFVIVIGASILVFSPRNPASAVTTAAIPNRPIPAGVPGVPAPAVPGIAGYPVPEVSAPDSSIAGNSPAAGTNQPPIQVLPATADPADMVRNSGDFQTLQVPPASASAIQENKFYINNDSAQPLLIERKEGESNTRLVINVPRSTTAAVPNAPSASGARSETKTRTNSSVSNGKTAGSGANTAGRTTAPARTAARTQTAQTPKAAAPAARPAPKPQPSKSYNAYWVQTGSFPSRTQADKAKEILAAKGLTAVIENGDVKGETWYRVRIGPYTSQNEADYWLSLIKSINGKPYIDLASSIVWKSNIR
jgi:DedD protein